MSSRCIVSSRNQGIVLGALFIGIVCANDIQRFQQVVELSGLDCQSSHQAFLSTTPMGLFECARSCVKRANCMGIFYADGSRVCHGCTRQYSASDVISLSTFVPVIEDAVFFAYSREDIFENSRYEITHTSQDFATSAALCKSMGGLPVTIETEEENTYVQALANTLSVGNVYIGLHQPGGVNTDWIWKGTGNVMGFDGFHHAEPSDPNEHCVALYESVSFQWADIVCSAVMPMICEFRFITETHEYAASQSKN